MKWLQAEILIIVPKPYQSTRFLYTIENSPMDSSRESQTWMNNSKFSINRGEKFHEVWIIVEDSRLRKLDFPNICNFFQRFSKYIYLTIICLPSYWLLLLIFWQTKAISPARLRRVSHLSCSTSFEYCFYPKKHQAGLKRISRCIRRIGLISGWGKRFSN